MQSAGLIDDRQQRRRIRFGARNRGAQVVRADIDTHGFAILDQLRAHFAHALSFLMDRDTLQTHQDQWVTEPKPTQRDLKRLSEDEGRLYDDLRWRRLREEPVRLEQERIGFGRVERKVAAL